MDVNFCLDRFEQLVYTRAHHEAAAELLTMLALLQDTRGALDQRFSASGVAALPAATQRERFCARAASAIASLFADPAFEPQPVVVARLFAMHEWLGTLFSASAHGNADHVARWLAPAGLESGQWQAESGSLAKHCLLYSGESELSIDFAALWASDRLVAANLGLALLSTVFKGSASAHAKREALLEWLPGRLAEIEDLDALPAELLHSVYMYCSYADTPHRHRIKTDINALVRRKLERLGFGEPSAPAPATAASGKKKRKKPLMLVVLEWFGSAHSIYRTHSASLAAAREHFEVVGCGFGYAVDDAGRAVFDRFIELEEPDYLGECLKSISDFAAAERPDVLYMPSVGMFLLTIFVSNLRVAPVQIAALGHPASTRSAQVDYISVEEDYLGDPACFTEKLLRLPLDGQPYVPAGGHPGLAPGLGLGFARPLPPHRETIRIVVTASPMKLNPRFLDTCRQIQSGMPTPLEFHFMTGMPDGLMLDHIRRVIAVAVPGATVHGFHGYVDYMACISEADMFLCPFPFGNTNGIVDALTVGLPGVCKTGPEVFEHIDGALFERAAMPPWTVASTVDAYIEAARRMATQHDERQALRKQMIETKAVERFFAGRPETFGAQVFELVRGKKRAPRRASRRAVAAAEHRDGTVA
jgi:hypothetical protein